MTEQNKKLIGIEVANNFLRAVCLDESGNLIDSSEFSTNPEIDSKSWHSCFRIS
jgi:predicted NBD/HSP70 family sugar kinase